ncbi:hypothetical protein [Sphingobium sp. Ant17]|uniref:hypothetical protein n=1 Tax=Sphingobium sp. Ant17 TaxID=1461752 RepID=UPI000445D70C|nr:hypothetical protein [Sphingobium sp. Ant17]EXS71606.1 hypothetical protein BF95_18785 [Sphingobium sp. Ant17]OHC90785.1 MAG: hypothetical protein A2095_15955 [Sphingomonadales bacterium GWF1_63_6]
MTTELPAQAASPTPARTAPGRRFTPRNAVRLAPDAAERQGRVTRLAIEALGASAAILFLNSEHDGLSDRPLPLATASEDGLQSVLRLLEPTAA